MIEAFHRFLRRGFCQFIQVKPDSVPFDEALQLVLMSYRTVVHSTTGESPAFLTYATDLRPAIEGDWRLLHRCDERDRAKFLTNLRLDIQLQAYENRVRANKASNKGRGDRVFELNDLVLCELTPIEMLQASHLTESGRKLRPRWSLPYRVERVLHQGKTAVVKNLITSRTKEVHLQHARFIDRPINDIQRMMWNDVIKQEGLSMFDNWTRREKLQAFWEEVDRPQKRMKLDDGS